MIDMQIPLFSGLVLLFSVEERLIDAETNEISLRELLRLHVVFCLLNVSGFHLHLTYQSLLVLLIV